MQTPEIMRKSPRQARAAQTVETLLETAAQILQREGEEGLTTNRLAERAGFSIGTLYQYFPNKEAIVTALAERERAAIIDGIVAALRDSRPDNLDDVLRAVVRTMVAAFRRRRRVRKIVVKAMLSRWQLSPAQQGVDQVAKLIDAIAGQFRPDGVAPLSEVSAFVLTRAVLGVLRAAVLEDSPHLETQAFEDEVVRLARNFLRD